MRWGLVAALVLATGCYFRPEGPTERDHSDGGGADGIVDHGGCGSGISTWSAPTRLDPPSADGDDNHQALRPQGNVLAFVVNRGGDPAIYVAAVTGTTFDSPAPSGFDGTSDLAWSGDGNRLYYTAGTTLMVADYDGSGFTVRQNDEFLYGIVTYHPTLRADDLELYFSDAFSLYVATRTKVLSQAFNVAVAVAELNSAMDERSPSLTADGLEIFFISTRDGLPMVYSAARASTTTPFGPAKPITTIPSGIASVNVNASGDTMYLSMLGADDLDLDLYVSTLLCL